MDFRAGCTCWILAALAGQTLDAAQPDRSPPRKQATVASVAAGAIRLDGRLDEEVWRRAQPITDFVQKEPIEGAPPSEPMEVRFLHDEDALFVGARMFARDPAAIQAPMGRRDEVGQAEHIFVSLDTYLDRRTAYTFGVTASGVRLDRYHGRDAEGDADSGFDPVWEAHAAIDEQGWTAEMWIPFSQLRFIGNRPQVWGLNVFRFVPTRNEEVYWALIPRTERAWASRFGDLQGFGSLRSTRRLELLPYAATASTLTSDVDPADPFSDGNDFEARAGLDIKLGLGPSLTLDGTVNPDFGQVEADPAEVNLSAFETFFDERRPFFLEGSELLNGSRENYFYSRRIGARPSGSASGDFVDYPAASTILGAAKVTGRLASGTSIGVLGAVTAPESARIHDLSEARSDRVRVAPMATYGVARVQQEFGAAGSTAAVMFTTVNRSVDQDDLLGAVLPENAFTVSGDSLLRFKEGEYELAFDLGGTYVDGEPAAIGRLQRSSARYFQRPDVQYVAFDPSRTSMAGAQGGVSFERASGRHWLWEASTGFTSPEFETNDIGRLSTADRITARGDLRYRETRPGPRLRNYSIGVDTFNEWNYGGDRQAGRIGLEAEATWPNFWSAELGVSYDFRTQDARLTRGGPSMEKPSRWGANLEIDSSDAAETRGGVRLEYGQSEDGGLEFEVNGNFSLQPGPQWRISLNPGYERELETQQFVTVRDGGRPETAGRRYVFAHIDRSTYSAEIRLRYTFKPDVTLDFYAEPFAASGRYDHFGELAQPRGRSLRVYGEDGTEAVELENGSLRVTDGPDSFIIPNEDFNVLSFRSNLVLRWEWRPGSLLYLVWQQDRESEETRSTRVSPANLFDSFSVPGNNFIALKMSFWLTIR
jgi:hypothetical protein